MDEDRKHKMINEELPELQEQLLKLEKEKKLKIKDVRFRVKWICIFAIFIIFLYFGEGARIFYHENVHAAIYDQYGINYTKGWGFDGIILYFYVKTERADYALRCDDTCAALQTENEIISYNQTYIYYALWMIAFIYLCKCFWEDAEKKHGSDY